MWVNLAKFFTYIGLLCNVNSSSTEGSPEFTDDLHPPSHIKPLVIASTVDGKVAALDIQNGGKLLWQIDLGNGPLVSSSISKLVYQEDGKSVRLIPSLAGGLFRFDGEAVEAVPFDVDQLLSSSFRLAEETVLVGGKETTTSGIDAYDGKILYSCNTGGCDQRNPAHDSHGILVIKRQQQTVRSIENRNGHENVGEVNLNFSKGKSIPLLEGSGDGTNGKDSTKNEAKCNPDDTEPFCATDAQRIKVIVPDGTICLVTSKNKHILKWKYQFGTPISSAWLLYGDKLYKLNLFDPQRVPALEKEKPDGRLAPKDTIYMGTYKDHAYIQASPSVLKAISDAAHTNVPGSSEIARYKSPRFTYRPYMAKANHLTQATLGQGAKSDGSSTDLIIKGKPPTDGSCGKVVTVYDEDNDKGGGYYLQGDVSYLSRIQTPKKHGRTTIDMLDNDSYNSYHIDVVYSSLRHWWKELFVLTVTVSIFVQCLIAKILQVKARSRNETNNLSEKSKSETYDLTPNYSLDNVVDGYYESRFLQDFKPLECLGKGGFGVVFKARNKMDDCQYAVKRILLPNNSSAREKVLREVRALAKLDHPSIVRYFNSWSEHPPQGWQKQQDDTLLKDLSAWSQTPFTAVTGAHRPSLSADKHSDSDASSHLSHRASPSNASTSSDDHVIFDRGADVGTTQGFRPDHNKSQSDNDWLEDTKSFVAAGKSDFKGGKFFFSDSKLSEASFTGQPVNYNNSSKNVDIPFKKYQNNSMSVVFDDGYSSKEGAGSCVFGQKPTCDGLEDHPPNYDDLMASGLRKRSVSVKAVESSTSELKSVVCTKGTAEHQPKIPSEAVEKDEKPVNLPERTMYLYIQMQLCKKESLREWLAANTNRERGQCIHIFEQVVSAVCYVHDQDLIHRDLKPSNVFFSLDGTVKVGDFGLVAHVGQGDTVIEESSLITGMAENHHTQQVGTRMYMAPEQMSSQNYNKKVDIYALGLILFELSNLFGTQMERIKHLTDARKLKFPNNFLSKFPQESNLALEMLSSDPNQRPSAIEISEHEIFATFLDVEIGRAHTKRTRTSSSRSSDSFSFT